MQIISHLIENKKLTNIAAAQALSSLLQSPITPTYKYIRALYALLQHPTVQECHQTQEALLLGLSKLVRRVYVDARAERTQFPVHVFGRFCTKEGERFLEQEYIPYLTQLLHKNIKNGNNVATIFVIRALGNVAHQHILRAYMPYLHGEKQCSEFQRFQMVASMDKLAQRKPKTARSVFMKIYQNQGEIEEVRAAAVFQLMRTTPSATLLQRMAQRTQDDVSEKVNSAVKTAIWAAAKLEGPQYEVM